MDTERVKSTVEKALEIQFSCCYTWTNLIDDLDLTDDEKAWAKEHLGYGVTES